MTGAAVDLIETFLDFYDENERVARQVVGPLLDAGFSYRLLTRATKPVDVHAWMWSDFARHRVAIAKACRAHSVDKGGWIEIRFAERTFLRVYYQPDGMVRYHFGGGAEAAQETLARERDLFLAVRERMRSTFDEAFLARATALVCRFFRRVPASGYRLEGFVGGERVTAGEWRGDHLAIDVQRIKPFFDFSLTLFQGADVRQAALRSARDLARFYEEIRLGLETLAGTLTAEGYRLEVVADAAPLFRTGKRVKPYPTSAFGNTEIRADHTLAAIARAMR